jgi:phage FluMu protein gp41
MKSHSLELLYGFTDAEEVTHKKVIFGKRLTLGDVLILDADPQGQNPTQYNDLLLRSQITEFGTLKMPVTLMTLLSLNSIDREDLQRENAVFLQKSREGKTSEYLSASEVKLFFGFTVGEIVYDVVEFGNLTTGKDEVEADKLKLNGLAREAFLIGRQIKKVRSLDGKLELDAPIEVPTSLDGEDYQILRTGATMCQSFQRIEREGIQRKRNVESNISADEGTKDERVGNSGDAEPKN